ncbi:MAG: hypothetical protein CSA65_08565 [Proteobacteria bacterium]|nr:MAG: hypothetical protein CSA65_08565 [Pseudomonadota bacterium]
MAKAKILLVDDEALVREELGGLLDDEGFEVITGRDGAEGLTLFHDERPDMVITDVRMPRVDGLSLVAQIRQESPTTPVTVITGHGNETTAIQALRAGVIDFIKKPVRFDDLIAALSRMQAALQLVRNEPPRLPSSARLREHCWVYELDNERGAIPNFVDAVLDTCFNGIDRTLAMELSLALRELILNAVEHGNLGLTYEEKTHALEEGRLEQLLEDRRQKAPYQDRRVGVVVRRDREQLTFEVQDDGEGFDWRALPDPMDPSNLLADHGRGVLLARMSVDELSYNEPGTRVTVVKRFDQPTDDMS